MRRLHRRLTAMLRVLGRGRADCDERGSLVVVLTVILIVVMLSSMLLVKVVGNQEIVTARQSAYTGVTTADAGLSDALFRLDQPADLPASGMMCLNALNPADTKCTIQASASTPQIQGISYVARTVPAGTAPAAATEWQVQAIGNASTGMKGAVQETLTRTALYPFALFGKESLTFNGNTSGSDFGTFTPGSGTVNYCSDTATNPPCLEIGSDGSISCTGGSPASIESIYYNTGSGGGSSGCGTSVSKNTTYNVPVPTAPTPPSGAPAYSCPNNGQLGSGVGYPDISPGIYVCNSEVTIDGSLTVSPATSPVQLYIMLPSGSNTVSSSFLNVYAGSSINTTLAYSAMPLSGSSSSQLPDSTLFQLFTNSIGNLTVNGNHGFVYGGVLNAPEATLTTNGCKSYFFGAAIINTYTCNGGPNLGFYYDSALSQYYGNWQVSDFEQINPSSVCIPDTTNNC